jgi:hypothetical protein
MLATKMSRIITNALVESKARGLGITMAPERMGSDQVSYLYLKLSMFEMEVILASSDLHIHGNSGLTDSH